MTEFTGSGLMAQHTVSLHLYSLWTTSFIGERDPEGRAIR